MRATTDGNSDGNGMIPGGLPGGFFIYREGGEETILFAEENVIRLYGCETFEEFLEFTNGSFRGMVHPEDLQKIENQILAQTIFGKKRHDYVRYRILTKQNGIRYVEDFGHLLHGKNGESFYYVFIVDVDQNEYFNSNRNSFAEAQILSANQETDTLTGLMNMPFFYQTVQQMIDDNPSDHPLLSLLYFDIPNFKLYNERNGFQKGDELLCEVAKILREVFPHSAVSRFSDDHFVVCADESKGAAIEKVKNVQELLFQSGILEEKVRIKTGIYFIEDRMTEAGLACDHARLACNNIKLVHDQNYCVYEDMLRDRLRKQQFVVDHIDDAISQGHIKLVYQPVIRVKTGEICGYEALVRWEDPYLGMLSPGEFVTTLEEFHLIHKLDIYVVDQVCKEYLQLKERGEDIVPISINISRLDFNLCDIFDIIEKTRANYDVPRSFLDIEITESALNDNYGHIRAECARMREMGYQIWLDDFGSGYSSLNSLADYSFDVLKMDMVFLRTYERNPRAAILIRFIVEGARALGVLSLCEGVESRQQYEFLQRVGCEKAQGYYFGKPLPMEQSRMIAKEKQMKWEAQHD